MKQKHDSKWTYTNKNSAIFYSISAIFSDTVNRFRIVQSNILYFYCSDFSFFFFCSFPTASTVLMSSSLLHHNAEPVTVFHRFQEQRGNGEFINYHRFSCEDYNSKDLCSHCLSFSGCTDMALLLVCILQSDHFSRGSCQQLFIRHLTVTIPACAFLPCNI